MKSFDYSKICLDIISPLNQRQKEVIKRRFALSGTGKRETLESTGKYFGITRERVRQIEKDAISKIRKGINNFQKVIQYFKERLLNTGGVRKEEILLSELGGDKYQPHVFFLLTVAEPFIRFNQNSDFYSFWGISCEAKDKAKKIINSFLKKLNKIKKPLVVSEKPLIYFLELSKKICKNEEGFYGLKTWPEVNPRNIRDKAFLVFKREGRPLHFTKVAELIGSNTLVQTTHNELIRDPRFVLVGRGIYALKEWGFKEGCVKDIILETIKNAERPLSKEEILEKVLQQRFVKKDTILLNLNNKKHFFRTPEGKYIIQKA